MKRIIAFAVCALMIFALAACGSKDTGSSADSKTDSSVSANAAVKSLKFDAEKYNVRVDGYSQLSDHLTADPSDAKVTYSVSDEEIATISKKGEIYGVKEGTVTVTAASEDGSVTATCTVAVVGFGTIVARNEETGEGGITTKRIGAPEAPDDSEAVVIIISKDLAAGTDMTGAVEFDYGERNADGYFGKAYDGYYVVKNNDKCNFKLTDVPAGDYVGLIVCSRDYTSAKSYAGINVAADLKASAFGKYFTDAELTKLASNKIIDKREYWVGEFTVKANETTAFGHAFAVDNK